MQGILEFIAAFIAVAVFFYALPTIIGIAAICLVAVFAYKLVADIFGGSGGNASDDTGYSNSNNSEYDTHNTASGRNTRIDQTKRQETTDTNARNEYKPNTQNRTRYSDYRRCEDADYGSYYDDWHDDIPPEEGDGFRGTGGPFL